MSLYFVKLGLNLEAITSQSCYSKKKKQQQRKQKAAVPSLLANGNALAVVQIAWSLLRITKDKSLLNENIRMQIYRISHKWSTLSLFFMVLSVGKLIALRRRNRQNDM